MTALASRGRRWADEIVSRDYPRLKRGVLNGMRSQLNRYGLRYDELDLEEFYNSAWQTLYTKLSAGHEIRNPEGFLVAVACRRAIDEARQSRGLDRDSFAEPEQQGAEHDIDEELDRRVLLRHFREGLKEKLTYRECQAATLCLILGLTRPRAAELLGVSRDRMERIMDDAQRKIGAFIPTITNGEWCEEHESMMRAYALGVHAVDGERYQLAKAHLDGCSRCQRFVLELRGLAGLIPPVGMPVALAGAHGATLAHLNRIVSHAWRSRADLLGSHVAASKGGAAAGASAGVGAGAGPALVGSGVGTKLAAVCAALCVASGAAIIGSPPGTHGGSRAKKHRHSTRTARVTKSLTATQVARTPTPATGAASSTTAATGPRTLFHHPGGSARRSSAVVKHSSPKVVSQSTTTTAAQEFGFEGSTTPSSPAPGSNSTTGTRSSASAQTASRSASSSTGSSSRTGGGSSGASGSSEFGFEGG
jgi:RNA polymerase sigma factor (sigma-70 family)